MAANRLPAESPFTPLFLPDLVLWLHGGSLRGLDGDVVTTWPDRSRRQHNATQSTASEKPLYKTPVINRESTVRFDGTNDNLEITNHADLLLGAGENATFFVVLEHLETGVVGRLFVKVSLFGVDTSSAGATGYDCISNADDTFSFRVDDNTANVSLTSGNTRPSGFFTLSTQIDRASNLEIWFDGASEGTLDVTAVGDMSAGTNSVSVGTSNTGSLSGNYDIAEMVMYKRALSASEHNRVGRYLACRYNLSWTNVT